MSKRAARRGHRWWLWAVPVLVLAVAAGAADQLGWVAHWRGTDVPARPPMRALTIAHATPGDTAVARAAAGRPDPARVRRAVSAALADHRLGTHVVAEIAPLTGKPAYTVTRGGTGAVIPASTLKLLTTAAALQVLGPGWRGATTVTRSGATLTVQDAGDILLTTRQLDALATRTATALKATGTTKVTLRAAAARDQPSSPHWPKTYVAEGVVAPIVPLWVDEGHTAGPDGRIGTEDDGRTADPTGAALDVVRAALAAHGVRVTKVARPGAPGATTLATRTAAPLDQVVGHILQVSDNEGAETLGHLLAAKAGRSTFAGGVSAVEAALRTLGIPTQGLHVYDASGLSRADRVPVATLAAMLQKALADPRLAGLVEGLPVAAWSGSLAGRFTGVTGAGVAHAKTGTLTGVSNLAGTVTTADGVPLVVVVAADRIGDTDPARGALDAVVSDLAACHCAEAR